LFYGFLLGRVHGFFEVVLGDWAFFRLLYWVAGEKSKNG